MLEKSDSSAKRPYRPTVYYHRGDAVVTDAYVRTRHGRFPIDELGELERVVPYAHPGHALALILAALEMMLALTVAVAAMSIEIVVLGLVLASTVAAGVLRDAGRHPRWFAIQARFRGADVTIFSTRDEHEYERVRLAVIRARDAWRAWSY
jgi:hypothetical protein